MILPKISVLILFTSLFITTHAFIQALSGGLFSGVSDTVKSLKPFNPFSNIFGRGAENQDSGILSNAYEIISNIYKGKNKEATNPSEGMEGYFRNAIGNLDPSKPISTTLEKETPVNWLRMFEQGINMQVDATKYDRTGEPEPVLLKSPQYLPLPVKIADPGHVYSETRSVIKVNE